MVIFHCYVKLPEATSLFGARVSMLQGSCHTLRGHYMLWALHLCLSPCIDRIKILQGAPKQQPREGRAASGIFIKKTLLVGGLEHFSIHWECHYPNWLSYSGWWSQTWMDYFPYMGCHPSHWRTPSFFKMGTMHHQPVYNLNINPKKISI